MTKANVKAGSAELAKLLAEMNEAGGFPMAVLTDRQGFPIASAAMPGQDPETQSAVVAMVQKTVMQVQDQLGMAQTDEISLYDTRGQRLVCRPLSIKGHEMILAVSVPDKSQSYRRLTNQTINALRRLWKL